MGKFYTSRKIKNSAREPGDYGAGARRFQSEAELFEATACPLIQRQDGTTCAGMDCPHLYRLITRNAQGQPTRGEYGCTAHGRTNAMGVIEPKGHAHG